MLLSGAAAAAAAVWGGAAATAAAAAEKKGHQLHADRVAETLSLVVDSRTANVFLSLLLQQQQQQFESSIEIKGEERGRDL